MEDIRLAIALIAFISVATFAGVRRLLKGRSPVFLDISAVLTVALVGAYVYLVWGQLWIVNWIPLPSVIILSNWFPILAAALAAIVWLRMEDVVRRAIVMVALVAIAAYSLTSFVPSEPPECGNKWVQPAPGVLWPVCLQTNRNTCSAAAAATILNTIGIETSEQEMARLCLTRSGTTWLGLYHGLSTQLIGTNHRVEFFEGNIRDLEEMSTVHPVLLCCELDPQVAEVAPSYVTNGGWIPGAAHSMVYFGNINGKHLIGDPSRGYEVWDSKDLNVLWSGSGLKVAHYDRQGIPIP